MELTNISPWVLRHTCERQCHLNSMSRSMTRPENRVRNDAAIGPQQHFLHELTPG
jgi:hypothetical protein